ncbi:ABC transporter substrate-binding protein [Pseudoruegeria sp. HB172150]|uniref:ABC transporter substrate-binding protein n=1 Tax=Pseudoruegeria sp. HB172150 TaxID=2721164 RepID=UPI001552229E|nr:ABC transporter substrate-binding protein [Pseudoruegeria sp. HB172150]
MVTRRRLLVAGAAFLAAPAVVRAGDVEAVDVLGNRIALAAPPRRIVLLDATDLYSIAALVPNPTELIVGWSSVARLDLGKSGVLPKLDIPEVGKLSADTVSVEGILALDPDLVVASAYMLPPDGGSKLAQHLQAAGIPVAWTSGHDLALPPDQSLTRAMAFWGAVLGQTARAEQVAELGLSRFDAVRTCAAVGPKPRVYMEIMSTFDDCCWAAGSAFWGDLFDMAGGTLLAGSDGWGGQLSEEGLISLEPEVYVATGGSFAPDRQPGIGPGLDPAKGREGLRRAASRAALKVSPAVLNGRVHGIWSGLISSPLLVPVLAECLGQWMHPENCADLAPAKTLNDLNHYFAHPLPGPLWLSLEDD